MRRPRSESIALRKSQKMPLVLDTRAFQSTPRPSGGTIRRVGFKAWLIGSVIVSLVACGSSPAPAPALAVGEESDSGPPAEVEAAPAEDVDSGAPEEPPPVTTSTQATLPLSTASYEQAMARPEPVDINDAHLHLTDDQLTGPVRNALQGCPVPASSKVTIKAAVQGGRAIGVTVTVRVEKKTTTKTKTKTKRRPSKAALAALKAEAKAIAKATSCVDHNVRAISWPPSRRRDSFKMEF